jgi:hypothetical protein
MKTKNITIAEKGVALDEAGHFLLKFFEHQINTYNEQQMIAWERNHFISKEESNAKMAQLKEQKEKLKQLLDGSDKSNKVDFTLSIGITVHEANPANAHS